MINALWITLIGMGLVFVAILLLWGLMALLVKLTEEREKPVAQEISAAEAEPVIAAVPTDGDRKRRAAAAAVAAAMAMRPKNGRARTAADQPAASVSAWQAVHRAGRLGQQMNASRKKVVR